MQELDLSKYPYIDTVDGLLERIAIEKPERSKEAEDKVARLIKVWGIEEGRSRAQRDLADMVLTREQKLLLFAPSKFRHGISDLPVFEVDSLAQVKGRPDVEGFAEAIQVVTDYIDHIHRMRENGIGLVLCGSAGVGKTMMGSLILKYAKRQGMSCCYRTADAYYKDCRPYREHDDTLDDDDKNAEDRIRQAKEYQLLLLDELFATTPTTFTKEQLELLVSYRYNYKLPIIITSNISWGAIVSGISDPLKDRLQERNTVLELDGPSYRERRRP